MTGISSPKGTGAAKSGVAKDVEDLARRLFHYGGYSLQGNIREEAEKYIRRLADETGGEYDQLARISEAVFLRVAPEEFGNSFAACTITGNADDPGSLRIRELFEHFNIPRIKGGSDHFEACIAFVSHVLDDYFGRDTPVRDRSVAENWSERLQGYMDRRVAWIATNVPEEIAEEWRVSIGKVKRDPPKITCAASLVDPSDCLDLLYRLISNKAHHPTPTEAAKLCENINLERQKMYSRDSLGINDACGVWDPEVTRDAHFLEVDEWKTISIDYVSLREIRKMLESLRRVHRLDGQTYRPLVPGGNAICFCEEDRELLLQRRPSANPKDPSGPSLAGHNPNRISLPGGSYAAEWLSRVNDHGDLRRTIQREILEETGLPIRAAATQIFTLNELRPAGQVHFCGLGIRVPGKWLPSPSDEGAICRIPFDELESHLTYVAQRNGRDDHFVPWSSHAPAHVLAWLANDCPGTWTKPNFNGKSPHDLFDAVVGSEPKCR